MHAQTSEPPHPPLRGDEQVAVVDGYGVTVSVRRGHLLIADGIGSHRRERRYPRATCPIRRVLILGHTGLVTLEAIRWCHDVGVSLAHLDKDGELLVSTCRRETGSVRVRRVQALAPYTGIGVEIARAVMHAKVSGQAALLGRLPGGEHARGALDYALASIATATTLEEIQRAESHAAFAYWERWATAPLRFERAAQGVVPEHWSTFGQRTSPISQGKQYAINPANALLNYLYRLLEIETTIELHAAGLDPTLGIWHTDTRGRESLTLDVMEAARPVVDAYVVDLLAASTFRKRDFHETPNGTCRILAPLTHVLAEAIPMLADAITPHVGLVSKLLDRTISREDAPKLGAGRAAHADHLRRRRRTPLTTPLPRLARCERCAEPFPPGIQPASTICASCEAKPPATPPQDPANLRAGAAKRSQALSRRARAVTEWDRSHPERPDPTIFVREILPHLEGIPTRRLATETGLSRVYCRRILRGECVPHAMHWDAFRVVVRGPV